MVLFITRLAKAVFLNFVRSFCFQKFLKIETAATKFNPVVILQSDTAEEFG